ncbi:ZIP family zinc transporter [Peribacillus deserti]|uniref:ZIP family zinc transporter n=1 Tax=Peribacillus deserti TaxID=673318 RepID=A0ABS2QM02_9BACI|nr:ZIP family metal transporter [Peribacillus deserti]MBM7694209.1 ZIP family zinc transporter [Peribacillus deserti]
MLNAALWGGFASLSLFFGSLIALYFNLPKRVIGFIMAFGTGILIGTSCFDLLDEAVEKSGILTTSLIFLLGSAVFMLAELFINKKGGSHRKRSTKKPENHSGLAIYLGTVMDAIPESIVIGISTIASGSVNLVFIAAIFISNFPESLSSSAGLRDDGYSKGKILTLWGSVVIVSAVSSVLGYVFLKNSPEAVIASIGAFGAGGLVAMVCSTMLPEAFEEGGPIVGFIASVGLIVSLFFTYL